MAAPLFSKICMYRYWTFGLLESMLGLAGGSVVPAAVCAKGDVGERCAVYRSVHVFMMLMIC